LEQNKFLIRGSTENQMKKDEPFGERSGLFPPNLRLHYRWEYLKFFGKSEVIRLEEATIFRIPNHYGHFRVGITIKSKGRSVDRNAVKRQIREYFRSEGSNLGHFDYNVVIPARKKMVFPYPQKLRKSLESELVHAIHSGEKFKNISA
jgi:ribonuclease P protein component